MLETRVIPCLLLKGSGLVKTIKFSDPSYLGDPINIVKIFNEKEVDELILVDITATREGRPPRFDLIANIADECFMPLTYGGGITSVAHVRRLLALGIEKIAINSAVVETPEIISQAADVAGSSSVVASIDVKKGLWGKNSVYTRSASNNTKRDPVEYAQEMEALGAGEILLNSIDRDGTMAGFDLALISQVCHAVSIPVIAVGGAGQLQDFRVAVKEAGASAVAAGSMFVYQGKHRAVLISYPGYSKLDELFRQS